jgi:hypothetical protein
MERSNSGEVIVTVELAKDFAEGTEIVSRFERIELGTDADGDPITSLVVLPVDGPIHRWAVTRKLSLRQQLALAAFDECAAGGGTSAPPSLQLPARTVVVQLTAWREELYLGCSTAMPKARARSSSACGYNYRRALGVNGELVWKA